jgi:hypothetical protein
LTNTRDVDVGEAATHRYGRPHELYVGLLHQQVLHLCHKEGVESESRSAELRGATGRETCRNLTWMQSFFRSGSEMQFPFLSCSIHRSIFIAAIRRKFLKKGTGRLFTQQAQAALRFGRGHGKEEDCGLTLPGLSRSAQAR